MRRNMKAIVAVLLTSTVLVGCTSRQELAFKSLEGKSHSAVMPVQQTSEWAVKWWGPRHDAVNKRLKAGDVGLLYIGDSITHGWESGGKECWDQYYAPRKAVNMGFSGDRTQHVLWRLDHSDFEGLSPKLAIIMIGTNNSNGEENTAEEIADGIIAICHRLRTRLPKMKILLLAIFPRSPEPCPQREKNAEASLLAPFEYLAMVFAAIVGFVFWGEIPVLTTWLGAAVIAASGIFIFRRRQKSLQADKPVEPVVIE